MEHAISCLAISDSCQQPPRHEMHLRMDLTFPYFALTGQYGSARSWRARPTKSVLPSARICSQYSGSRRECEVMTGIFTTRLVASAAYVAQPCGYCIGSKPAPGDSCMPCERSSAATPARSRTRAVSRPSSMSRPPGHHSSKE